MTEAWLKENIWPRFSRVLARDEIYLANHSLGRPPDKTFEDVARGMAHWYEDMDRAWEAWMEEATWFRSSIAELISAPAIAPKASAGQGLRAVLNALEQPVNVVTTTAEFDSMDFILRVYEARGRAKVRWTKPDSLELIAAINDNTDIVLFSLVFFESGAILQGAEEVIEKAHSVGANVIVDVYHAVGVIPVDMRAMKADFMIGGSYKYMRGGPGASWLAYADSDLRTLDTGWFAKKNPFEFSRGSVEFGDAWLESTPAVLPFYQARAGIELVRELGVERLREYSLEQQHQLRESLERNGVEVVVRDEPEKFGAFSCVRQTEAAQVVAGLSKQGINVDSREDMIRFCPDILNTCEEIAEAARVTATVLRV